MKISDKDLPGLYQSANNASLSKQKQYFAGILWYLILLILAALFMFFSSDSPNPTLKIISLILFLITLSISVWLRIYQPNDTWYNGRAVAESVKTRSWRWMMKATPYEDGENAEMVRKLFVGDLLALFKHNESLFSKLGTSSSIEVPITKKMEKIRNLELFERIEIYKKERITDQELWYFKKSQYNKKRASLWFWMTICLHAIVIVLLIYNIKAPNLKMPIEVFAVGASSVLTWLQAKKHNELSSSYTLTAHEIILIKSDVTSIDTEEAFSFYVINCENAFSREHTQWFARKNQ